MKQLLFLFNTTLMYSTPLIFAALGGLLSEKSGVINIGLEGIMTIGAFAAAVTTIKTANPIAGLLVSGLAGMALVTLHAIAAIKYKANQIISGVAINFLGSGMAIFLCRLIFDGTSMTPPLDIALKIPTLFGQFITVYLSLLVGLLIYFILNKTRLGLRLISVGENPKASKSAGINSDFYKWICVLSSGFLAGIGGASLSIAVVSSFRPTLISGQGFIAIAALIFGKWKPLHTIGACLFFAFSQTLVIFILGLDVVPIPSQLLAMIPYLLTLFILVLLRGKTQAPSALGE